MGEYADMANDDGIDSWRGAGRSAGAQYWPDEPGNRLPPQYTHATKRCRRCGQAPLYWEQVNGKWRLHAFDNKLRDYVLHACAQPTPGGPDDDPA